MQAAQKLRLLAAIAECLRTSPVASSLEPGWPEKLLGPHRKFPERDPSLGPTVTLEFDVTEGWISVIQEGGGVKVILWAPGARDGSSKARAAAEDLQRRMHGIVGAAGVQLRMIPPHEWMRRKGWPLKENTRAG